MTGAAFVILGLTAWLGFTFGPPFMLGAEWRQARLSSRPWLLHIAFVPVLLAVQRGLCWLIFYAAHDDGDGPPGLGLLLLPGLFLTTITLIFFGSMLIGKVARHWIRRSAD